MTEQEMIGSLAVLLGLYGYGSYMRGVFAHKIRPHVFTWVVWGVLMSIAFAAQLSEDTGPGTWNLGASTAATVIIAIISIFYGDRNITKGDWVAFIASLSAIPAWLMSDNAMLAVAIVCAIDLVAFWPTLRKSWIRPHQESALTFSLTIPQFALSLVALDHFTFVTAAFPLLIIVMNTGLVLMLLLRRKTVGTAAA